MGRFFEITFEWLLILLILLFFAIRTNSFQNFLADETASYFSSELQAKIEIDQIDIVFFDRVNIEGLFLEDQRGDTLGFIESLDVNIGRFDIQDKYFYLDKVSIDQPKFYLKKHLGDTVLNLKFLTDYFTKKEKDTTKANFDFRIEEVALINGDFKLWDENKALKEDGMDFSHLSLSQLNTSFKSFRLDADSIFVEIEGLSVKERCGFVLDQLNAGVKVSPAGVELANVCIETPNSSITTYKLDMMTKSYQSYRNYINEVVYDSKLETSTIALIDIAYFAPILGGSDERVVLSSSVKGSVRKMEFRDIDLKLGTKTELRGAFDMPDFEDMDNSNLFVSIDRLITDFDDLEQLQIPTKFLKEPLKFSNEIKRIGKLDLTNVSLSGDVKKFKVDAEKINTSLGNLGFRKGITFIWDEPSKQYVFGKVKNEFSEFFVEDFDLGRFLGNSKFGKLSGNLNVSGKGLDPKNLDVDLGGKITSFDFNGYSYSGLTLNGGHLSNDKFSGKLDINDPNLEMSFDGLIGFSGNEKADFNLDVAHANLSKLGFSNRDSLDVSFKSKMNIKHFHPDKIDGRVAFYDILLKDGESQFVSDSLVLDIERGKEKDIVDVQSDLFNGQLEGKFYTKTLAETMKHQVSSVFPTFYTFVKQINEKEESDFKYHIIFSEKVNDLFDVFVPSLKLSSNSKILGNYHSDQDEFDLFILADTVIYSDIVFEGIDFYNQVGDSALFIDNMISKIHVNDSLSFRDISLSSIGKRDTLKSILKWGSLLDVTSNPGLIHFNASIQDEGVYGVDLGNSYFHLKEHKWNVSKDSRVRLIKDVLTFDNVMFSHEDQFVSIDGNLSKRLEDKSIVTISNFNLADVNSLFGGSMDVRGMLNGCATIASPTEEMYLTGEFDAGGLQIDDYLLGDLFLKQNWDNDSNKFELSGRLIKEDYERFNFNGNYFTKRKKDQLDAKLNFDYTDISFVNSLLPGDDIQNIRGMLAGSFRVHGALSNLVIDGDIDLHGGNVKVDMLGANFGVSGKIHSDKYGFTMDKMPLIDEEGNAGYLYGAIFHEHFKDWNFNVDVNIEEDYFSPIPGSYGMHEPLNKFMLMNASFEPGAPFYGKAYGTGRINVFGYANNMEFDIAIKTQEGTDFYLPIFNSGDLEKDDFITFIDKDSLNNQEEDELDLSGISLNLGFEVNEDAKVHILLDEEGNNKLDAIGNGYVEIGVDQLGDLSMIGDYFVTDGTCNLNLSSIIKKDFRLQQGGTVSWSGDPYNAILDVQADYITQANIYEASPSLLEETGHSLKNDVHCALKLEESLLAPKIRFGINSPKANDNAKSILSRIESDNDELNRQFFSLLLLNKFQPIDGDLTTGGTTGAIGDIVSSQINSMLDNISDDFKLGVGINSKDLHSGDYTIDSEFNLDPDKRLTLKTSFGYSNSLVGGENVSSLIGDIVLEYKLNKQGSFRVNVFNESNDNQVIQDKKLGSFTQGAGLYYTESFNGAHDFKMLQYFLNIFRTKDKKRRDLNPNRGSKKVKIPEDKMHLLEDYNKRKKDKKKKD